MREHALPQDVTGYKFHLIGNMTLKQFAEVAAGFVVAFFIYQTNLASFIKWPLMGFFAGIGAMIAFVPIEERPLDQWILAFFRALYRPTQYYWKRVPKIPEPFLYVQKTTTVSIVGEVDLTPARRERVKEYLRSLNTKKPTDQLESFTEARLSEVMNEFQTQLTTSFAQPALAFITEEVAQNAVDTLSFIGRSSGENTSLTTDSVPSNTQQSEEVLELFNDPNTAVNGYQPNVLPEPVQEVLSEVVPNTPPEVIPEVITESVPTIIQNFAPEPEYISETSPIPQSVVTELPTISSVFDTSKVTEVQAVGDSLAASRRQKLPPTKVQIKDTQHHVSNSNEPLIPHIIEYNDPQIIEEPTQVEPLPTPKKEYDVIVPEIEEIRVERSVASRADDAMADESATKTSDAADPALLEKTELVIKDAPTNVSEVTHNADLPFPDMPTIPNKVVGMVLDPTNNPIPNTIVEILTPTGLPARAVKTNPIGQFFITTPLNVGEYLIKAERDGFTFPTQQLVVNDKILNPIEIKATG